MEAYTGFAQVYDLFMDNIPYEEWSRYLISLLTEYGVNEGLVADLGCGTGSITEHLSRAGYEMIGIDNAEEMLEIAREKSFKKGLDILYLQQDMQSMELYGTVAAFVSICDSINYITEEDDLREVFRLVNNYLDAGGLFIFDLNTKYKYEMILAQNTFAENRDNCSFIWENYYYPEEKVNEYDLTIYVRDAENKDRDVFYRFDEEHYQRSYELEEIKRCLTDAGMEFIIAYDAFTREMPRAESERIYVVARECRQAGKYYEEKAQM